MSGPSYPVTVEGVSIVVVGSFNPAIFHPLWFSTNNLLPNEETDKAEIKFINQELALFSVVWLSVEVLRDRFAIHTKDPTKYLPLRDIALGTFRILEHTPIKAFGFNHSQHIMLPSESTYYAFGHHLAPKKSWLPIVTDPGTRSLVIEGRRKDCDADRISFRVEPSAEVKPYGIQIHLNEHNELADDKYPSVHDRNIRFLKGLQDAWDPFLKYSYSAATHLCEESCKSQG